MRISDGELKLNKAVDILSGPNQLQLTDSVWRRLKSKRDKLDRLLRDEKAVYYGINTGFGALCNTKIASSDLRQLQENLIRSHACGTGPDAPLDIVKWCMLAKISSLRRGYSGVRPALLKLLINLFNRNLIPAIPQSGSLGASGDLAPLAHLSLPLIGEGLLYDQGSLKKSATVLKKYHLKPIKLAAKEGLALINGTQYSFAWLAESWHRARQIFDQSIMVAALSCEAINAQTSAFHPLIHELRNHIGQISVADKMRNWLRGSQIHKRRKTALQDPYSFRCIPQILGPIMEVIKQTEDCLQRELNAVSDNPIVGDDMEILSGGNFHAQALAMAADHLALALAELGSVAERRLYVLLNGQRGLPDFLATNPGLESGMMIVQYSAAALASQNKQLSTPASIDSIITSQGQEDHVSMAANAGMKLYRLLENTERIIAMELLTALRAWQMRDNWRCGSKLQSQVDSCLSKIKIPTGDVNWSIWIQRTHDWLRSNGS